MVISKHYYLGKNTLFYLMNTHSKLFENNFTYI